jgi:hypothetical protein
MTDNLELWHRVEKTPTEHTKAITGKSYKGTSPKPHYLIQKATETFGPCGIGWGFTVDERVENGALISEGFYERLHVAKVKVWYRWQGDRGEVEHIGGTVFSGKYSSGKTFTDEDAPKKSVTDALVKALSMIGFAGDIFMGRYDDSKYVSDLKTEERQQAEVAAKPEPKPISAAEQKRQLAEIDKDLLDAHSVIDVKRVADIWQTIATRDGWSRDYKLAAKEKFDAARTKLSDAVSDIEETFPGSRVVDDRINDAEASRHPLNA